MAVARFSNQLLATTAPADIVTQPQAAQAALLAESRPASPSARARRPRLAGLAARQCPGHSSGEPAAWESPNRRNRSERLLAAAAAAPTWAPGQVRARALARSGFTRSPRPAEAAAARQFSGFTGNALLAAGHDSLRPLAAFQVPHFRGAATHWPLGTLRLAASLRLRLLPAAAARCVGGPGPGTQSVLPQWQRV